MFGKRPSDTAQPQARPAPPPPAAEGAVIATRPQRMEPAEAAAKPVKGQKP